MDKFNRGGGRGGFGGNRGYGFSKNKFRGNDRRDREVTMHEATCDECHKKCQVPFRPSGDKPVYCSDCFESKRESPRSGGFDRAPRRDFSPRPQTNFSQAPRNDDVKKQLDAMNLKLDNLIRTVEMMSKPEVRETKKKKS